MGVNSLPKIVTRQRRGCDLNPGPSAPESGTLTTRLPRYPHSIIVVLYLYNQTLCCCTESVMHTCNRWLRNTAACLRNVSGINHGTDGRTDGRTPDRRVTLSAVDAARVMMYKRVHRCLETLHLVL